MCEVKVVPGSRRLHTWHRPLPPLTFFPWVAVLSGLCVLALNVKDGPLNSYVFERILIKYFLDGLCAKKKKTKTKKKWKMDHNPFPKFVAHLNTVHIRAYSSRIFPVDIRASRRGWNAFNHLCICIYKFFSLKMFECFFSKTNSSLRDKSDIKLYSLATRVGSLVT